METKYLSCAETAKLVRTALKKNFAGVKFSVRSSVYSGGASIDMSWVLGPTTKEVDAVAGQYKSADFDGSIDMETRYDHWLLTGWFGHNVSIVGDILDKHPHK